MSPIATILIAAGLCVVCSVVFVVLRLRATAPDTYEPIEHVRREDVR